MEPEQPDPSQPEPTLQHQRATRRAFLAALAAGLCWLVWFFAHPVNWTYFDGYIFHVLLVVAFWIAVAIGVRAALEARRLRAAVLGDESDR